MRKKILASILGLSAMVFFVLPFAPVAAASVDVWGTNTGNNQGANVVSNATNLAQTDPRTIASRVINIILGFLGIIAVCLILFGGFKWMTAMGNDENVGEAKKIMIAGVIGLVIVLAAFAIATFAVNQLGNAVSS